MYRLESISLIFYWFLGVGSNQFGIPPHSAGTRQIKNDRLNISIGDNSHTDHFLNLRPGGEVISFGIPKWMDQFIVQESHPQWGANKTPHYDRNSIPLENDPTIPGRSYELPRIWAKWLEEVAISGFGKIVKPHD